MMQAVKISEKVYWVGAIDWGLRNFHGYSTHRGTTYNAYLILGEKPTLIDTVKHEFYSEMMQRIKSVLDPQKIRIIISNHSELDHSGALAETVAAVQP
ncbi:MAG: anaerobic nitric oxide reductase flavorubredoxin, partial [Elusimicrobiaceae bacterium]|nr:anaerobic nitric oxide reductase flavorubredoxin [Elusimicrobiaceae bacterium]